MQELQSKNFTLIMELDIRNLEQKILDFVASHEKKSRLEAELISEKYIQRRQNIRLRELAKKYKCPMKKVTEAMESSERKLYSFLSGFIE